jgi:hypothetical protein
MQGGGLLFFSGMQNTPSRPGVQLAGNQVYLLITLITPMMKLITLMTLMTPTT